MKRIIYALVLSTLSAGAAMAADERVTLIHDHELPNVPGKSIRPVLVESGPGGSSNRVSVNASTTEPAKLLAVFFVDTNETELTTPIGR